ncbi:recombinase family protein [Streptomyces sp. So13.3]|uniref:recombinase family protein n=1 Tax=Streptomyces sp. So13.3 TaxID=2136173 RepID=UPI001106885F|nr:recombinase family protein [Streptomyces sp. So13.3]QNA75357.1 recombinase family protein [Streptomyces sp. So13.3]
MKCATPATKSPVKLVARSPKTLRAVVYARLSKNRYGLSTNTAIQVAECLEEARHYARDRGRELVVVASFEEDDVSASRYSTKPRPDYDQVVDLVRGNWADVIFGTEMERLCRRPREIDDLITLAETTDLSEIYFTSDEGYDLSTSNGIYRARQAVNQAERESRKISERTRRKQAERAKLGFSHGGHRAFGFKAGNAELEPTEAVVLHKMADRIILGHSFKEVAYWANEAGYRTTEGKLWYPITVRNMLLRKRYIAIRVHKGAEYPAQWPAVFKQEKWDRLQLTIKLNRDSHGQRAQGSRYLLTGFLVCGKCGKTLNGMVKRDRATTPLRRTYLCRVQGDTQRKHGCGGVRRGADPLEDFIAEAVLYRLDTPDLGKLIEDNDSTDEQLGELLTQRSQQKQRLDEIMDDYGASVLTRAEMTRAMGRAKAALEKIESDIDGLNRHRTASGLIPIGQSMREAWEKSGSDEWRRQIVGLLIERVIVHPGSSKPFYKGKWRFDPTLIEVIWRV